MVTAADDLSGDRARRQHEAMEHGTSLVHSHRKSATATDIADVADSNPT